MVGDGLDVLDALGVGLGEILIDAAQRGKAGRVDALELGQRNVAQGNEILDFDFGSVAYEREL